MGTVLYGLPLQLVHAEFMTNALALCVRLQSLLAKVRNVIGESGISKHKECDDYLLVSATAS